MNDFDNKLKEFGLYPLKAKNMSALVVIMGHKCNLRCTHCYLEASPERTEEMPLSTLNKILHVLRHNPALTTVNISGGSAELTPHFRYFAKSAADMGKQVMVSSNLAVYFEPGIENLPEFLAENKVVINASLPHYTEDEVDKMRGKGTYKKSIASLKRLNNLGYGKKESGLTLNLLYNPPDAKMAPDVKALEDVYREKLKDMHGIVFNKLFTINNIPMGRFGKSLTDEKLKNYLKELEDNFNPAAVENMMCRTSISYDFDGRKAYDCDFWRILNLPVKVENSSVENFDYDVMSNREVVTHPYCFICTAGRGVGCCDLLV